MGKIKILYTIPNFDTAGSGIHLLSIAKRLDFDLFEPQIACRFDRGGFFQEVKNTGMKIYLIDYYINARPLIKMLYECYKLSRIFKKIAPDIIHSYNYAADYTEPLAARMAGIKWIYTKKNMSWKGPSYRGWRLRTFLANGIIAQNSDMIRDFFYNNKKAKLIPMGIDIDEYKKQQINSRVLEKWNINSGTRVIMSVANLIPIKGMEILIKAFEGLYRDYTNWVLMIVGNDTGNYAMDLKKYLDNKTNLKERVVFTGVQKNIRELLNIAEIYVHPTLNVGGGEGGPVATLEAMANGKIIIGSNIPGIRDQLLDHFPHHLFNPGNITDLKQKLNQFMENDKNTNKRLGNDFYNYVKEAFNISIQKQKSELFYLNLTQ